MKLYMYKKRVVHFAAKFDGSEEASVHRTDVSRMKMTCPLVINDYNINMVAVDKAYQLRGTSEMNAVCRNGGTIHFGDFWTSFLSTLMLLTLNDLRKHYWNSTLD